MRSIKTALLILLSFALCTTVASAKKVVTNNKITKVTVFPKHASLTRTARHTISRGEYEFIFDRLPTKIWNSSLRASASGSGKMVLLDAKIKTVYKTLKRKDEVTRLKNKLQEVGDKLALLFSQREIIEKELQFLNDIKITTTKDINKKIALKRISPEDWAKLYTFIFSRTSAKTKQLFGLAKKIRALKKVKAKMQRKYYSIYRGSRERYKQAIVRVRALNAGNYKISISYKMRGAYWRPAYDFRLSNNKKEVEVTYFAVIRQRSGEDWENVQLNLSTARPFIWSRIPRLRPWYLWLYTYRPYHYKYRRYRGAKSGSAKADKAKRYFKKSREYKAIRRYSRTTSLGTSVTFSVPGRTTLKSDGSRSKKLLIVKRFPVNFVYKALPQNAKQAFIEGNIKNISKLFLLPGYASIFKNNHYIGRTRVRSLAPNAFIKLFFGTDQRISTKKELLEKKLDPGSDNEWYYKYKLTVTNNKKSVAKVQLLDTLPVSKNTKIEVDIKEMSRKPTSKNDKGIYKWDLSLQPGQTVTIVYRLKIEYPSKKRIRGLR